MLAVVLRVAVEIHQLIVMESTRAHLVRVELACLVQRLEDDLLGGECL